MFFFMIPGMYVRKVRVINCVLLFIVRGYASEEEWGGLMCCDVYAYSMTAAKKFIIFE